MTSYNSHSKLSLKTFLFVTLFALFKSALFGQTTINVVEGTFVSMTAPIPSFPGPYTYQWFEGGQPISTSNIRSANSQTLQFAALIINSGSYSVRVISGANNVTTTIEGLSVSNYEDPLADYSVEAVLNASISAPYTNTATAFNTIPLTPTLNERGLMDSSGYHVVASGKYILTAFVRPNDVIPSETNGLPEGMSWGMGVDKNNQDTPAFFWTKTNTRTVPATDYARNGATITRIATFDTGDTVKLYIYSDHDMKVIAASFSIKRVE